MINQRNISLFVALSILGLIGVFFVSSDTAQLSQVMSQVNITFLILCVIAVPILDWLIAGFRMWLFTNAMCPDISYWACVKNSAVGGFMAAMTPSQTGGGIAQLYVLAKEGARGGQAVTILFMTFLSTLIFYTITSLVLWTLAISGALPGHSATAPFALAAIVFVGVTTVCLVIVLFPDATHRRIERIAAQFSGRPRLYTWLIRICVNLDDARVGLKTIGRDHKIRTLLSLPITVALFANKYIAAYVAALALGLHPPFGELIIIQVFLNVMLYFFPTPGASGGAEVGTAILMRALVPEPLLPAYTVLWRTATTYLSVLVGGLLLTLYVRREKTESGIS